MACLRFFSSVFSGAVSVAVRRLLWRRWAVAVLLIGQGAMLSACSGPAWVDSRREAGTITTRGESQPDRPVICFDEGMTSAAQLQAMADQVCAQTKRHARFLGVTRWQCSLDTPHRAYYRCE